MKQEVVIIIAEDDIGQAKLIKKNLYRVGIQNEIIHFLDGEQVLEFFFNKKKDLEKQLNIPYVLLLDIRMPKVNGIEVLRAMKQSSTFKNIPIIMVTTSDNPEEVQQCYDLGCSCYIKKPVDYKKLTQTMQYLGSFLKVMKVPFS